MKIFKNVPATLLKACLCLAFVAPMFSSCVDGDEIWGKIEEIEGRLDSLEKGLNGQIEAMTALLEGGNTLYQEVAHRGGILKAVIGIFCFCNYP